MKIGKFALALSASVAALAFANPAMAADCAGLTGKKLASGKVDKAELVGPGEFKSPPSPFGNPPGVTGSPFDKLGAFCRVQATLTPTSDSDIKVEVWMPVDNWNGRYLGLGNGVWAGQLSITQIPDPLSRGYAVATTDTGHTGTGMSGDFAVGHPEKLVDFGHRAVHEMTLAAKEAIEAFYGKAAGLSVWTSCSTGGRQGVMSAYRYPEDYDVISSMAPANPMTDLMTQSMWAGYQPAPPKGEKLTAPLLALVNKAVLEDCDNLDGIKDGIVSRPEACTFDPVVLGCKPGESANCLTKGQVATVRAIYDGVTDPRTGAQIIQGWPRGAELQLGMLVSGPAPFPVALSYFQLLVHGDDPQWDWKTMDFGREAYAGREYGAHILDVPSDGLGAFFARGGRLLLSHGWTDGLIPATNAVKFYRGLYHSLPREQAQDQLRLFMVPGMDHCAGGVGATQWNPLDVVEEWVETGQAPNRIVAKRGGPGGFPGAPQLPPISRPLCPYPLYPHYSGEGDEADEASFDCAMPQ